MAEMMAVWKAVKRAEMRAVWMVATLVARWAILMAEN